MTPLRWRTAGWVLLVIAAVLILIALYSALQPPVAHFDNLRTGDAVLALINDGGGVLRAVVLGAFAGVAFFLGLACFGAGAVAEARRQREDILLELTALRQQLNREPGTGAAGR